MKKVFNLSIILAVLAAAFSFTSCGNDDPVVTLTLNATSFGIGGPVTGKITSDNKLENVRIEKKDANGLFQLEKNIPKKDFGATSGVVEAESGSYLLSIVILDAGEYTIQAFDTKGTESKKVPFTIACTDCGGEDTPLSEPEAFTWQRVGNNPATGGLADFGLSLSNTGTAVQVISSSKLVLLTATDWSGITTEEALKARIDAATAATGNRIDFTFAADTNPNVVFGVLYNNEYAIFRVDRFRSTAAGDGTRTSIFNGYLKW